MGRVNIYDVSTSYDTKVVKSTWYLKNDTPSIRTTMKTSCLFWPLLSRSGNCSPNKIIKDYLFVIFYIRNPLWKFSIFFFIICELRIFQCPNPQCIMFIYKCIKYRSWNIPTLKYKLNNNMTYILWSNTCWLVNTFFKIRINCFRMSSR